jgi:plasmid stability protein
MQLEYFGKADLEAGNQEDGSSLKVSGTRHARVVEDRRRRILEALVIVDTAGAVVAARHRIAGEPLDIGGSLDVRNPLVLVFWGSGLSAPIVSLIGATILLRLSPTALRAAGALFAIGAIAEPALWGRRSCPRCARALLAMHVALGTALATVAAPTSPTRRLYAPGDLG